MNQNFRVGLHKGMGIGNVGSKMLFDGFYFVLKIGPNLENMFFRLGRLF